MAEAITAVDASPRSLSRGIERLSPGPWTVVPSGTRAGGARVFAVSLAPKTGRPPLAGEIRVDARGPFTISSLALAASPQRRGTVLADAERICGALLRGGKVPNRDETVRILGWVRGDWTLPKRFVAGEPIAFCTDAEEASLKEFGFVLVAIRGNDAEARGRIDALQAEVVLTGRPREAGRLLPANTPTPEARVLEPPPAFRSERPLPEKGASVLELMRVLGRDSDVDGAKVMEQFPGTILGDGGRFTKRRTLVEVREEWFTFEVEDNGKTARFRAIVRYGSDDAENLSRMPLVEGRDFVRGHFFWSGRISGTEREADGTLAFDLTDFAFQWIPS